MTNRYSLYTLTLNLIVLFSSCTFYYKPVHGRDIDSEIRNEIASLCNSAYHDLQTGNTTHLRTLFSSKAHIGKELDTLTRSLHTIQIDTLNKFYTIQDEFYLKGTLFQKKEYLEHLGSDWQNDYRVTAFTNTNDSYVILFSIPCIHKGMSMMVYCNCVKEKGTWKLSGLWINNFTFLGLQAPQFYEAAKKKFDSGDFWGAAAYITLSRYCALPTEKGLEYNYNGKMVDFYSIVEKKIKIPVNVNDLPGGIEILACTPRIFNGVPFPIIMYKTALPIFDSVTVDHECTKLNEKIDNHLPYISRSFDSIKYMVVNEYPNQYHQTVHLLISKASPHGLR